MVLCEGHCTRIKPAVDDFGNSLHGAAAVRTFAGDLIDERSVKLNGLSLLITARIIQILSGSDADPLSALTLPDIERCAPVTVSGKSPVLDVLKPVSESSGSDGFGHPVYGVVVLYKVFLYGSDLDVPGFTRIVKERSVASPAERIIVLELGSIEELPCGIQILKNKGIGILDELSFVRGIGGHITLAVYELNERKIVFAAHTGVVFTECGSDMNDTGTVGHGYIVIDYNVMCFFVLLIGSLCGSFEKGLVLHSLEVFSDILLKNFVSGCIFLGELSEKGIGKSLRKDIGISVGCLDLYIALGRIDAECDVGRKGPGCGRPCKEIEISVLSLETYDCGALLYGLVALSHLV